MPTPRKHTASENVESALRKFPALPDEALVPLSVVQELFGGISRATLYRRVSDGTLPEITKVGSLSTMRAGKVRAALAA